MFLLPSDPFTVRACWSTDTTAARAVVLPTEPVMATTGQPTSRTRADARSTSAWTLLSTTST